MKLNLWQRLALRTLLAAGLENWLTTRALVLPSARKTELQFKLKIKKEEVDAVEAAIQLEALSALHKLAN